MNTCVNCQFGPQPYDVLRFCPHSPVPVRETTKACKHFYNREVAFIDACDAIDKCGERGK